MLALQQQSSSSLSSSSSADTTISTLTLDSITTSPTPPVLPTNEDVQIVSNMPEPLPLDQLRHQYYLLRHGQSTANVASVISSDRSLAYSQRHGLTAVGYQQATQAAESLIQALEEQASTVVVKKGDKILFVSSPFARARQTAQACLQELCQNPTLRQRLDTLGVEIQMELDCHNNTNILLREQLMERYFGRLDDEAIYTYAYVWPVDKFNVTHTAFDVESVAAVCTRIRSLIMDDLEQLEFVSDDTNNDNDDDDDNGCKYHIVMASHADVLQIAQLYGANAPNVGAFSSYRFANGEVRRMQSTVDSLPEPVPLQPPKRGTQI
ncbi:Pfam:PGAM [Seminavis robusta]|uniref:Pfam:PGAM n=1 Tax=Seminavis robusta TaxID=568900 RepID=A0A9N8EDY0_9STRA|nr:Pfam:PGAM [Seminavis robusta]|eukprot:Sro861_g212240.1 Pfam:PGAM (323) ;mRNA; f:17688-18656